MKLAVIALGGNLGNRVQSFSQFLQKLRGNSKIVLKNTSFLYDSPAADLKDQPYFTNAAIEVETLLSPQELLYELKTYEVWKAAEKNMPRKLDLDIILYDNQTVCDRNIDLRIPHQKAHERAFVLKPLMDLGYYFNLLSNNRSIVSNFKILDYSNVAKYTCSLSQSLGVSLERGILMKKVGIFDKLTQFNVDKKPDILTFSQGRISEINRSNISKLVSKLSASFLISLEINENKYIDEDDFDIETSLASIIVDNRSMDLNRFSKQERDYLFEHVAKHGKTIVIRYSHSELDKNCSSEGMLAWIDQVVKTLVKQYYIPRWSIYLDLGLSQVKSSGFTYEILKNLQDFRKAHRNILVSLTDDHSCFESPILTPAGIMSFFQKGIRVFNVEDVKISRALLTILFERNNLKQFKGLIVSNLPAKATRADILDSFKDFEIRSVLSSRLSGTRAFVVFVNEEGLRKALTLNNFTCNRAKISVKEHQITIPRTAQQMSSSLDKCTQLFVGNLPKQTNAYMLWCLFKRFGAIAHVHIDKLKTGSGSENLFLYSVITFHEARSLKNALNTQGLTFDGRHLSLDCYYAGFLKSIF